MLINWSGPFQEADDIWCTHPIMLGLCSLSFLLSPNQSLVCEQFFFSSKCEQLWVLWLWKPLIFADVIYIPMEKNSNKTKLQNTHTSLHILYANNVTIWWCFLISPSLDLNLFQVIWLAAPLHLPATEAARRSEKMRERSQLVAAGLWFGPGSVTSILCAHTRARACGAYTLGCNLQLLTSSSQ
jgi:hypothetical protein